MKIFAKCSFWSFGRSSSQKMEPIWKKIYRIIVYNLKLFIKKKCIKKFQSKICLNTEKNPD